MIHQGQAFRFDVPDGWRVMEEGQFAVVLVAGDNTAMTMMVGNCGLPAAYQPLGYAHEKLSAFAQQLAFGAQRPAAPVPGFGGAMAVDFTYAVNGVPCQGVATVSGRPGYGTMDVVLVAAAAQQAHWPRYADWLPAAATRFEVTDGGAWGARGIMQQNLANSQAFGQQLQEHREHSQQLQQEVTDARWRSDEVRQHDRGEGLTGESWYESPFGHPPQRLDNTMAYTWVHRSGAIKRTDDPGYNPRDDDGDPDWQRMTAQRP